MRRWMDETRFSGGPKGLAFSGRPRRKSLALRAAAKPVLVICALLANLAATEPTTSFTEAIQPRNWSFPRDHGRHDGFKLEWWYYTGHLRDASGHRFGYQLTFFRSAFRPQPIERESPWAMTDLYFAHAAISD